MKKKPTAVDLFSGIGGLTEGLTKAKFRVLGAVENDALAVETYKINHPNVRVWDCDIQKLPASRVLNELGLIPGQLDLLAGCPPCQGFSKMTTLNGRHSSRDPRNALVFEFVRFVRVMRPKAVMLENVPGLGNKYRQAQLVPRLRKLGYYVSADVLNAADYGVPQRRKRFILVGGLFDPPQFGSPSRRQVTVRRAFSKLEDRMRPDPLHMLPEKRSEKVRRLIRRIPRNGGSRQNAGNRYQLDCHRRLDGFKDVYGRMAWNDVAPTITGGCCNPSKGRFLHPSKNRCITLREAAVLQSFPPSYFISLRRGKFAAAQMIGNALPPEFVRRHAVALKRLLLKNGNSRKW